MKIKNLLVISISSVALFLGAMNSANAFSTKCPGADPATTCHGAGSPQKSNGSTPTLTPIPGGMDDDRDDNMDRAPKTREPRVKKTRPTRPTRDTSTRTKPDFGQRDGRSAFGKAKRGAKAPN